jgi:glutathione synthase/RimK-type ligase-like ATP-grasp enzyme
VSDGNLCLVVDRIDRWPLEIEGVRIVSSETYLLDAGFACAARLKVFNLCRSYQYQSVGYYVSLLAEARGHRPFPDIATILDMKANGVVRIASGDLDKLIQQALKPLQSDAFTLSIYFGRNLARRYDRLANRLFNYFPAPLLRAQFVRRRSKWELRSVSPIPASQIPENHRAFAIEAARAHFARRGGRRRTRTPARYDLALLYDPDDPMPPSNEAALERFEKAGERLGLRVERIGRDAIGRLAEFDGLFIRATTGVNHYTYRFAQRARALGLSAIDAAESIVRCANKVYLAEQLAARGVPMPATRIFYKKEFEDASGSIDLPCVLKQPDSAFSLGVKLARTREELRAILASLFEQSDLVVAQEYTPTPFDWRIGVLDRKPLYACKYFMATDHWQIVNTACDGEDRYGKFETLSVERVPKAVVRMAVKAASLIGDGLYGVDLKETRAGPVVIEVNDNPNLDAGVEDQVLGERLYEAVMQSFLERIEALRRPGR